MEVCTGCILLFLLGRWTASGVVYSTDCSVILTLPPLHSLIRTKHAVFAIACACILVFAGLYILKAVDLKAYVKIEIALTRIPIFLVGGMIGKWVHEKRMIPSWERLLLFGVVIIALGAFGYKDFIIYDWKHFRIFYLVFAPALAFGMVVILDTVQMDGLNACLRSLGSVSLEWYLIHVLALWFVNINKQTPYAGVVIGVGSLVLSLFLHYYVFPWIYKRMEGT